MTTTNITATDKTIWRVQQVNKPLAQHYDFGNEFEAELVYQDVVINGILDRQRWELVQIGSVVSSSRVITELCLVPDCGKEIAHTPFGESKMCDYHEKLEADCWLEIPLDVDYELKRRERF